MDTISEERIDKRVIKLRQKNSDLQMGFEPMTFCFTHISPLLTIESTNVQWLELPPRYEGLWVQIPAGTKIFFSKFFVGTTVFPLSNIVTLNNPIACDAIKLSNPKLKSH